MIEINKLEYLLGEKDAIINNLNLKTQEIGKENIELNIRINGIISIIIT